jgi:hypothetical protein
MGGKGGTRKKEREQEGGEKVKREPGVVVEVFTFFHVFVLVRFLNST